MFIQIASHLYLPFNCLMLFHGLNVYRMNIYPLKDLSCFQPLVLMNEDTANIFFSTDFGVNINFNVSGINAQVFNC